MLSLWPLNAVQAPITSYNEFVYIEGNSIKAITSPIYLKPQIYGDIIGCLEWHESRGNENAVGDKGLANGILQFHKSTFDYFCEKYGLKLDYCSSEDQKLLADYMLQDNFNNIRHWSVYKRCLN